MSFVSIEKLIAERVAEAGGRTYYVGGCVRDRILADMGSKVIKNLPEEDPAAYSKEALPAMHSIVPKDVDIEVHGIEPDVLLGILSECGEPLFYGKSFGVYSLKGQNIDIAMPRRERAINPGSRVRCEMKDGAAAEHKSRIEHDPAEDCRSTVRGHRDFEIDVDPFIGTYEAARRRDFTINALMQDVLSGEIIDHFGGLRDLGYTGPGTYVHGTEPCMTDQPEHESACDTGDDGIASSDSGTCTVHEGVIRHVDPDTFAEDPLRVLRAAQFAARFGFEVAPETVMLCRGMDLSLLSRERVCEEMKKALLRASRPSIFFETLREMDQLGIWFPELESLIGVEQDPVFHPEGDVWVHTMEVLDRAAEYRNQVSDAFSFMLLALTHDMGKTVTTEFIKGRIHAYKHETMGVPIAEKFVRRLTGEKAVIDYVMNMVPLHMRPNVLAYSKPAVKSTNRMFDAASAPEDLIYFAQADKPVVSGVKKFTGDPEFLHERFEAYREIMARPYVMGRDLVEAGLEPGEDFAPLLEYAHKLRLAGIDKESALKQVLAQARKTRKASLRTDASDRSGS